MDMSTKEIQEVVKRLQRAKMALMREQPFYSVLLLHTGFALDPMSSTAYTDGEKIAFGPDFINELSDRELQFVLMHEVLHMALEHCSRTKDDMDFDLFNIACDIVVNSNILHSYNMDLSRITLKEYGESMHIAPDGKEGYLYDVERVYAMLVEEKGEDECEGDSGAAREDFDDHTFWDWSSDGNQDGTSRDEIRQEWVHRMIEAAEIAESIARENGGCCGNIPATAERRLRELLEPQTDWRTVLDIFIQEEVNDYSFNPPDRRFQNSVFLLPDYNEKAEQIKNILFMIDTSGSMSELMVTEAYSEIKGAIDQFDGNLQGWLGFFDAQVITPQPFEDEEEFKLIKAEGGGGTSFNCIFNYVREHMSDEEVTSIVILTDGYAPWPDEEESMGIPVLWIINNENVTPPWGRLTRIKSAEDLDGKF